MTSKTPKIDWRRAWKDVDKWFNRAMMACRSFPEWDLQKRAIQRIVNKQLKEQSCRKTTRSR